jgi:hypothetical protein
LRATPPGPGQRRWDELAHRFGVGLGLVLRLAPRPRHLLDDALDVGRGRHRERRAEITHTAVFLGVFLAFLARLRPMDVRQLGLDVIDALLSDRLQVSGQADEASCALRHADASLFRHAGIIGRLLGRKRIPAGGSRRGARGRRRGREIVPAICHQGTYRVTGLPSTSP